MNRRTVHIRDRLKGLGYLAGFFWFFGSALAEAAPETDAPALALVVDHDYTYDHSAFGTPHSDRCHESGTVVLALEVDSKGLVSDVSIAKSSGVPDLDVDARQEALGWRYRRSERGRHKTEKVVFESQEPRLQTEECSASATKAYARILAAAPLVNPGRVPKGMLSPILLDPKVELVDLEPGEMSICGSEAYTRSMNVVVASDGKVERVDHSKLWGVDTLDHAADNFAKALLFRPATRNGEVVPVTRTVWMTPRPQGAKCQLRVE